MKKLLLTLATVLIGLSSAHAVDYYLIGGFNDWTLADASCKFTEGSNGVYTLDLPMPLSSGFKINDGTWDNDAVNFGSNGSPLTVGDYYKYGKGGPTGNIEFNSSSLVVTNAHLELDPINETIKVTGQQEIATIKYGIHGKIFGSDWETVTMIESSGNWVLADKTISAGEFGIKALNSVTNKQTAWYSTNSAADAAIVVDKAVTCVLDGKTNFTIASGTYTFTFNPNTLSLTVTGTSTGETPEVNEYGNWWVNIMSQDKGWTVADDPGTPSAQPNAQGIVSFSNLAIGTAAFEVKTWDGQKDGFYSMGSSTYPVGEWTTLGDPMGVQSVIEGATATSVYNIEFNVTNNQIKITLVSGGGSEGPGTGGDDPTPTPGGDYSAWWVNIMSIDKGWTNPEGETTPSVQPNAQGIATFSNLPIGTAAFEVKTWDGQNDGYYSMGSSTYPVGEWTTLGDPMGVQSKIEGATANSVYNIEFNVTNNQIKITLVSGGGSEGPGTGGDDPTPGPGGDYSAWWVNIMSIDKGWTNPEGETTPSAQPNEQGIVSFSNLAIGTAAFEVKTWDGMNDVYYSMGTSMYTVGDWIELGEAMGIQSIIEGSTPTSVYNIEFNITNHMIKITDANGGGTEGPGTGGDDPTPGPGGDYSAWWVNIMSIDKGWTNPEGETTPSAQPNEQGIASFTNVAIGTAAFEVKTWDGKNDVYYSMGTSMYTVGEWIELGDSMGMQSIIEGATPTSVYNIEFNITNNKIKITDANGSEVGAVNSIEAEEGEAVYYNLQGQRVENPERGIYVRVVNGQAVKVAL